MSVFSPFIWDGDWYNSAAAAFHASKLESRTARIPFISTTASHGKQTRSGARFASGICARTDTADRPPALGDIASS
ncbi:MAG TPA: hypothetical protein VN828_21185, partial [Acidobacteriaceae bacterium]|nr:hypothetical protein [Acidobacteriaceae bacterium]